MKSTWRTHWIICLFLGLLAFPIYFLDSALAGQGGAGNWITLDFRGLIFWTYMTLLAMHVVVSSIAVGSFPNAGAWAYRIISSHQSTLMQYLTISSSQPPAGAGNS